MRSLIYIMMDYEYGKGFTADELKVRMQGVEQSGSGMGSWRHRCRAYLSNRALWGLGMQHGANVLLAAPSVAFPALNSAFCAAMGMCMACRF